jgi:hypothetical protein
MTHKRRGEDTGKHDDRAQSQVLGLFSASCNDGVLFYCGQMHNHKPIVCHARAHMPPICLDQALRSLHRKLSLTAEYHVSQIIALYRTGATRNTAFPSSAQLLGW